MLLPSLPLLVVDMDAEVVDKKKRMTSPRVVALAGVRCASGYSVGSLSPRAKHFDKMLAPSEGGVCRFKTSTNMETLRSIHVP